MRKTQYKTRTRILILVVIVFCLLVGSSLYNFERKFFEMELKQKQKELEKTAEIKAESVRKKYEKMVLSLTTVANHVKGEEKLPQSLVGKQIGLLAQVGYFDHVGISDSEGNAMDSEMTLVNIKEREYFQNAMKGKISISDVIISQVEENQEIQVLSVPIEYQGIVRGVVFGIVNAGTMDRLMENETGSDIYTQIVDSKGNYITRVQTKDSLIKSNNVWKDFEEFEFLQNDADTIKQEICDGKSGSFTFKMGKEERVSFYMPLGFQEYYVFSTINNEHLLEWTKSVNRQIFYMVLEIAIAFTILLIALVWYSRSVEKELQKALLIEKEKEKEEYQKRAEIDGLTGLYNAATVKMKMLEFLESPESREGIHLLFVMDLDNFKQINDTFGHQFGDQVLEECADILRKNLRDGDILGRLGGDEFVALMKNATEVTKMTKVFERFCEQMTKTYTKDGVSVKISASFGIVEIPRYGFVLQDLYAKADQALYEVKRNQKNGFFEYQGE